MIVSRRAARVGTAARACFICARRAAATAYVAVGPAARARAAALRGEQAKQEALTVPALHAARCSRHVASRGRLLPFGRANNNALGETAARVSAVYRALLCASVLQAASKHRARTRRRFAFHALEDVTPRLLVDFGPWLRRLDLAQLSEGHRICAVKLEARGRLSSARTCFYHSAAFHRERFEGADAAVLQSSLHHKELQQI